MQISAKYSKILPLIINIIKNKKRNKSFFKAKKNWQLAIFAYTIFAVKELNFCVRDGNRCILFAIVTNLNIEKIIL